MPLGLIGSAAFYLASSAGMSILNKLAVTALPLPVTLVVIQMAFTTATTLCGWRLIHIGSLRDALRWGCTVPLLFNAMLVSSMFAMRHNTLGTIAVFRNIAPLFTLAIERVFRVPIEVDGPTIASLLTIVLGVGIYHAASIQFSRVGLTAIGVNIVFAVLERILQRYLLAQEPVDLSKPGMMLLNNAVGIAINGVLLVAFGEAWSAGAAGGEPPALGSVLWGLTLGQWGVVAASCANGVAISYAGLRVQQLVTATTFMVLTNANKLIVILYGAVALGERTSLSAAVGMALSLVGSFWYARARAALSARPKPIVDGEAARLLKPVP